MSTGRVYLFGAGGHAKVIFESLEGQGVEVAGFFDQDPRSPEMFGRPVLRYPEAFDQHFDRGLDRLVLAVGDNAARRSLSQSLQVSYDVAVHPSAVLSPRSRLGAGTVVMAGVVVNADTVVGEHCVINTCASIDHDCVVEDHSHISPNVTLCGTVHIGEGTHVGSGAVVIPGTKIGRWAVVGAGAVVIADVPDHTTVVGNPARALPR